MVGRFAKSVPAICMFTNKVQDYVYDTQKFELLCGTMQSCLLIPCNSILLHYKRKVQLLAIVWGPLMELSVPSAVLKGIKGYCKMVASEYTQ